MSNGWNLPCGANLLFFPPSPPWVASTCLEPWQQLERVVAANPLEIARRKTELHHAFSRLGKGDERIVTAEQNLCGRDKTRQCRDRRPIGSTGDIVVQAFEFVFDSVGYLFGDILGSILVHAAKHHRHVATRVG